MSGVDKFNFHLATSIGAVTRCVFTKTNMDPGMIGPLERARQWALDHSVQMVSDDTLVFHEKMEATKHDSKFFIRHHVFEIGRFVSQAMMSSELFFHEIVPQHVPCKISFDFELDTTNEEKMRIIEAESEQDAKYICERARTEFMTEFCQRLAKACGRDHISLEKDAVHLVCHRPGKWSEHWIFDGARDGLGSIVFKSPTHCAVFVADLLSHEDAFLDLKVINEILDRGIWNRNHPLRTALSSKRGFEQYCFTQPNQPRSEMPLDVFVRSLVSCIGVVDYTRPLLGQNPEETGGVAYVSSSYIKKTGLKIPNMIDCSSLLSKAGAASMNSGSMPRMLTQGRGFDLGASRRDKDRLFLVIAENNLAQQKEVLLRGSDRVASRHAQSSGDVPTFRFVSNDRQSWFERLVQYPPIAAYNPTKVVDIDDEMVIINCVTKACRYKTSGHSKNDTCVFLLVDMMRMQFSQRCHSSTCKSHANYGAPVWCTISGAGQTAIEEYFKTSWPLRTELGQEFLVSCDIHH
jgi:hypothetical protein